MQHTKSVANVESPGMLRGLHFHRLTCARNIMRHPNIPLGGLRFIGLALQAIFTMGLLTNAGEKLTLGKFQILVNSADDEEGEHPLLAT